MRIDSSPGLAGGVAPSVGSPAMATAIGASGATRSSGISLDLRAPVSVYGAPARPAAVSGIDGLRKQVVDRVLAGLLLVVLAPLLVLIAVLVRFDSPGPALFCQERVGRDGRTFRMLKFRSMARGSETALPALRVENDHGADAVLFKMRHDPRVTRIGSVLRRTSLDELPQLVNVVTGSMSLVGPRPALPTETARYVERDRRRLSVRPGLTGLWQVSGRSDLGYEESIGLDLAYIDHWSPALDVRIALDTVRAVISGRGAY